MVQTVDFFPPIVDDPYQFGQIAAANALSDVYAMGGKPITALNIVGFPLGSLPEDILARILRGGGDKVIEAGAVTVGGHSVKDKELKYGLAVTGLIHPDRIITNSGAKVGDSLYLTKPIGTGIVTTGIKRQLVSAELSELVATQMATLNKAASEIMVRHNGNAATDITGFGLLGHLYEMAVASEVSIEVDSEALPVLKDVVRLAAEGVNPGGAADNRKYLEGAVSIESKLPPGFEHLLYDPQTSGGLLVSIGSNTAADFARELDKAGLPFQPVGRVVARGNHSIIVK